MRITKIQRGADLDPPSSWRGPARARRGEEDEGDERLARDAVRLEAVRLGPTESPALSPVQSAMTPGLRTSFLLDLEDDLHEVGADVGDLGEDAARDSQRRRAQRLADCEADEGREPAISPG